jgi:hypothetical protein
MKKKTPAKQSPESDDLRPEYDFTGGLRGKHFAEMQKGYTIRIYKKDGSIIEKLTPDPDAITLEPDVREYFPNSKAVNRALRTLISLVPQKQKSASSKGQGDKAKRRMVAKGNLKSKRSSV